MEAWAVGIDLLKTHPIFGVGFMRFGEYFFITAHNTIVVCAAELGMFGLFWWVMFVIPTIRDAAVCSMKEKKKTSDDDVFSYDRAMGVRRDTPATPLRWQEPQLAAFGDTASIATIEATPNPAAGVPLHLAEQVDDHPLSVDEIHWLAQCMLVSVIGYFVAGWFLSRAYIMTLFIYGGMVQVIYTMAMNSGMVPARMRFYKVMQYSAAGSVGLILVVYLMLRFQHLAGVH